MYAHDPYTNAPAPERKEVKKDKREIKTKYVPFMGEYSAWRKGDAVPLVGWGKTPGEAIKNYKI